MKKLITVLVLASAPLLLIAPNAQAHDRHAKHHYHDQAYYRGNMPRWLRQQKSFRHWYRQSGLRGNLYLGWDELFSIYRWEVRYTNHRRSYRYDRGHNREFRYYRRYWNDQYNSRKQHRYGDRKHNRQDRRGKKRDKRRHS